MNNNYFGSPYHVGLQSSVVQMAHNSYLRSNQQNPNSRFQINYAQQASIIRPHQQNSGIGNPSFYQPQNQGYPWQSQSMYGYKQQQQINSQNYYRSCFPSMMMGQSQLMQQNHQQQNQVNNSTVIEEHQLQVKELKSQFQIKVKPGANLNRSISDIGTLVYLDIETESKKIPIKIELYTDFPKTKPKVFLMKCLDQKDVKSQTLQVMYEKYFTWNPKSFSQDQPLKLVWSIQSAFQQNPPHPDYLEEEIQKIKGTINEQVESAKVRGLNAKKVFKQANSDSDYEEILQKESFANDINKTQELQSLFLRVADIAEFNVITSQDLKEQLVKLEEKQASLMQLDQMYEDLKVELSLQVQAIETLKDRFSVLSLAQSLAQKIEELEMNKGKARNKDFDKEIRKFKENRQQYYLFIKKRDVLMNSN